MTMQHNYFRILDLNPQVNGGPAPVNSPTDPRALCYFEFLADGQDVEFMFGPNPPPVGVRIFYTFDHVYSQGGNPPLPPTAPPTIHGVIAAPGPGPFSTIARYTGMPHERRHVIVWMDPQSGVSTAGPVEVWVKAQARQQKA